MRCKSCDVVINGAQLELGLCKPCTIASEAVRREAEEPPERAQVPEFSSLMALHPELIKSWKEGSGLTSITPEARCKHLWERSEKAYHDHISYGLHPVRAFEKATGLANRGNQRYAHHGVTKVSGQTDLVGDYLDHESVSYDFLWE